MVEKLTTEIIRDWVVTTTGSFTYKDLFFEKGVTDPTNMDYAYVVMKRLCEERLIKAINGRHGTFRLIDTDAPVLNWKGVTDYSGIDMLWPFELEKFVKIHPRNVIVVGGDPNKGKTAFLHNVIALNWRKHNILLLDSENSKQELALRFSLYEDYELWPDDIARERSKDFGDAIEEYNPDGINIVDYLEIHENFYAVGKYLREIRDALTTGIAIVAIQKAKGAELPIGRDFSQQIARLVLTIDPGILTIRKVKSFAQRNVNPNNMKFKFKLEDGAHFTGIEESWMA